ncbi:MAG: Ribosomal protein S12 methylthiotransferase RimO [Chlamydiae bacterium]|nr:Ribosomal protein S12 methylthiotransferase RimO [Chlamydiota bacterium]
MSPLITDLRKIHFTSLGCARNLVDTEVMLGIVLRAGFELTGEPEEADFLVVNTCGFLSSARQEALDVIEELFEEKKESTKVIVAGCMVQKHSEELKSAFPKIHYMLGSGDVEKILEALSAPVEGEAITDAKSYLQWGEIPRSLATPNSYAYLKIAEGCAKRCAFCIIPTIKGVLKSKPALQVKREFEALLDQGIHEVILIAQDLGDWGKEKGNPGKLEELLETLLTESRKFWLRLLYLYPDEITEKLIDLIASDRRICPYLDMPIQHINNEILKKMRRKTSSGQICSTIEKLREKIPDIVIRTSLMVGFPGETEEQFAELLAFVKEYPLDNVGVFNFSAEEGAAAARFENQISEEVKEERYHRLMEAQLESVRKRNKRYIGKRLEVVIEGYHPDSEHLMRGRFYGQCPEIDGMVIINDTRAVTAFDKLYEVEITDALDYDLVGAALAPLFEKKSPLKLL